MLEKLFLLGSLSQSVDHLMQSKVEDCDGGFVCMLCGKICLKKGGKSNMRRHMREIHLSLDEVYQCPLCDKYFKNQTGIYNHIKYNHKEWKGVNYDNFAVKS